MTTSADVLGYYGPQRAQGRTVVGTCWRLIRSLAIFVILLIVIIVRAALLLTGLLCVFIGTLLLMLGGRRSAAEKLSQWRKRFASLMRLWIDDLLSPLRRQRQTPLPVLPA